MWSGVGGAAHATPGEVEDQAGKLAETIGALCIASVAVGMAGGIVTGLMLAENEPTGIATPFIERAHLITFGSTLLFSLVLLVGVLVVLLAGTWDHRRASALGLVTLLAAVPLSALVVAGTAVDLWSYVAQGSRSGLVMLLALRATAVLPALAATWLALATARGSWPASCSQPACPPNG